MFGALSQEVGRQVFQLNSDKLKGRNMIDIWILQLLSTILLNKKWAEVYVLQNGFAAWHDV